MVARTGVPKKSGQWDSILAFFKKKNRKEKESRSTTQDEEPGQTIPDTASNQKKGRFRRLRQGLSKTRSSLTGRLDRLFLGKKEITEELLEDLEEILFTSDIGVATTQELIDSVQEKVARKELKDPEKLKGALKDHMLSFLNVGAVEPPPPRAGRTLGHNGCRR